MTFLVDANVLSETTKPQPNQQVLDWLRRHEQAIVVDPVILGELRFGILLLPKGKRRQNLERWFNEGARRMTCLPWDAAVGLRWAELLTALRSSGEAMPVKDSMIAATALTHGLTLATRNGRDFGKAKVKLVDPWG